MRSATAAAIAPDNYNAGVGAVTFRTKFGTWQTLPVTAELAALFASAPANVPSSTPYVCALHPLGKIGRDGIRQHLQRVMKRVGITRRFTPHDLRRTTATVIYTQTHDVRIVQAVLGHKQLATTLYYLDHRNTPVGVSTLELAKLNPITEVSQ